MLYIWPWQAPALPPERLISSMITLASPSPSPGAAVLLGNHGGQPTGRREGANEFFGVAALCVDPSKVRVGVVAAELAHALADLAVALGRAHSVDLIL